MNEFLARVATTEDFEQMKKIRIEVFVEGFGASMGHIIDTRDTEATNIVAIEKETQIVVGGLRFLKAEDDSIVLSRVAVDPKYQGKGIGTLLMQFTEDVVRDIDTWKDIKCIKVGSVCTKQSFYEKCGYHDMGEFFVEQGLDHLWMYKAVNRLDNSVDQEVTA